MIPVEAKEAINDLREQMNSTKESLGILTGITNAFKRNLESLSGPLSVWEPIVGDVSKYVHGHYHNDHAHQFCHEFNPNEEAYAPAGGVTTYPFMPPVLLCRKNKNRPIVDPKDMTYPLMQYLQKEYTYTKDYDGNGLIFGLDFVFNPTDRRVPFELRRLQKARKNLLIELPKLSWLEYFNNTWMQGPWHKRMCKGK